MSGGHICFDLDGTLAVHGEWRGVNHIGAPIAANVDRLLALIAAGHTVKIMTARVCRPGAESELARQAIHNWLKRHGLPKLEVTCVKDYAMRFLVDDRVVSVETNTGKILGGPVGALDLLGCESVPIPVPETSASSLLILPKSAKG